MASSNREAAVRTRIVNHMNKDHTRELSHYLRHYAGLPAGRAAAPVLKEISLENMAIQARDGATHLVPFDPPMASYAEARARVVDMDKVARQALGLKDVYLTEYLPPRGPERVLFGVIAFYYACLLALPWTVPGSPVWAFWDAFFPGGAAEYKDIVVILSVPVFSIHIVEMYLLDRTKLVPHGVERFSGLWWKWMVSCSVEGFATFKRINAYVKAKKAAKDAKSL